MILDERTEFLDANTLNGGGVGTYLLGDVVDLMGSLLPLQNRDVGHGEPIYFVVTVDTTVTGAGGSLQVNLVTDDNSALSSPTVIASVGPVSVASGNLAAGKIVGAVALPTEGNPYERYLGIQQQTVGAALTAGAVSAFLVLDVAKWRAYQDAQN